MTNIHRLQLVFLTGISLMAFSACYKPHHIPLSTAKPTFEMRIDGGYKDDPYTNVTTINKYKNYPATFYIRFRLISGDPSNYPITLYFTGLPASSKKYGDSLTFRLNKDIMCYFPDTLAPGIYPFDINVSTPDGLTVYPARFKAHQ